MTPVAERANPVSSTASPGCALSRRHTLGLRSRVTFAVGPNAAGKNNMARLLTVSQCAKAAFTGAAAKQL